MHHELQLPATSRRGGKVDDRIRHAFVQLIARLSAGSWTTLRVPDSTGRGTYPVPKLKDENAIIFTPRQPDFDARTAETIVGIVRSQGIKKLHIFDTPITRAVSDVCLILSRELEQLVICDHHLEEPHAHDRLKGIQRLYQGRSHLVLESRENAPTCYELVATLLAENPEWAAPKNVLYLCSPFDFDGFSCIAASRGLTYEGQAHDALVFEARDRKARAKGVSKRGATLLDAMRTAPWVIGQQGHKTFATLLYLAGMQAIAREQHLGDKQESVQQTALQVLKFLGDIAQAVGKDLLASLILQKLSTVPIQVDSDPLNVSMIDLTGSVASILSRFDLALTREPIEIYSPELDVTVGMSAPEAILALIEDHDRLRMKSVLEVGSYLISEGRLPNDCFIFVRYPGASGNVTRFASFGRYRDQSFQAQFPFLGKPGRASGEVARQVELFQSADK